MKVVLIEREREKGRGGGERELSYKESRKKKGFTGPQGKDRLQHSYWTKELHGCLTEACCMTVATLDKVTMGWNTDTQAGSHKWVYETRFS